MAADILPSLHVVVRSPANTPPNRQHADSMKETPPQSLDQPSPAHIQHTSQHPQQQESPQHLPGHAASVSAAQSGDAPSASAGSPFAHSNGDHTPGAPPSPMTPLIPLGSIARAPSGDIHSQQQTVSAGSSGSVPGVVITQGRTQATSPAVPMPARQLPLPRPQSRPQHGPVNAGPTLHPARGSQVMTWHSTAPGKD